MVNVEDEINTLQQVNASITPAQMDAGFNCFLSGSAEHPAIAGLALRPNWVTLNAIRRDCNAYYWNPVDDAFDQVAAWNIQNPAKPQDNPAHRDSRIQFPRMVIRSDSKLRRPVSDTAGHAAHACGKTTLPGFRNEVRRCATTAMESGLQKCMANVFDGLAGPLPIESLIRLGCCRRTHRGVG